MKEQDGEDVMVDVVGSDPAEEDDHVVSVQKEMENCDQDMVDAISLGEGEDCDVSAGIRVLVADKDEGELNKEEVAGSGEARFLTSEKDEVVVNEDDMVDVTGLGEDNDDSVGIRVLASEKDEVVNEAEVAVSAEDCNALVETRVLTSEKVDVTVNEEDTVDVVGFGEDCDAQVETRVLESEKVEVTVNEEDMVDVTGLGEDCDGSVETRVSASDKDKVVVNEEVAGSGEDCNVKVIVNEQELEKSDDVNKLHVESVEEVLTTNLGSVDPSLVYDNNQSSAADAVSSGTDEVGESVKEDRLQPIVEVITDDAQETTDADHVLNDKIEKENEVSVPSEISETLVTVNPGSEGVDVVVKVDIPVDSTIEVATKTDAIVNQETEAGLNKNEEVMEKTTEPVQEVVYENGVMEDKTEKEDETVNSSEIPESLTTVNLGPEGVNTVTPITDADMDRGDDTGMDVDEVMGWKDEVTPISANSEANVEQKLPEPSSEPVLVEHQEEHIKSQEPIVYGRRAHVEVPLYESLDVDQKLSKPSSPVSEDENLKIETDSEQEDDDDDNESVQEDDKKVMKQKPRLYKNGNLFSLHQMSYFKPPETEGDFSVSDLVWGKVISHPWWPGQIIDPSGASKKAMKYYKKDSFLVAYFGDHSFAWNSPSVLSPFRANFSQYANQTNTEIFKTAVSCALDEVSRRVKLGLACSCTPKEIYKKIEYQVTENGGVRIKSSKIHGKDESAHASSFEPDKLVDYVRLLAQFPDQGDGLDLAIAKAQLTSYGRYKWHRELTEFLACGDMLEEQEVPVNELVKPVKQVNKNGEKIENDFIDVVNPNKEISLSDITDDAPAPAPVTASESVGGTSKPVSSSGLKKRKARLSVSNGSVKKQARVSNKVSTAPVSTPTSKPTPTPKPSFKIGEMIQRVASQLTGPPSVIKSGSDPKVDHGQQVDQTVQTPENSQAETSVADMLSQLHLTAQDPMKEHSFFQTIIPFFYERRAAVFSKSLKKPPTVETPDDDVKLKPPNENEPEEFKFDFDFVDVNDSYWTDRIIQNHSEDQPMQYIQDDQNGAVEESQIVEHEPEKPAKRRRQSSKERSNKKERSNRKEKRAASSNRKPEPEPEPVPEEPEIVRKRRENLATEVVLKFEEGINFRSEAQLNKMFRRFGPLMESETEVDRAGGRARVVFKKCSDAEVAHNSAGHFNIFGSVNVSYELNYSPLVSYKPLPLLLPVLQEDLQPVLRQDPLPVLQEDPPQVQEDPIPMPQGDLHRMLQEEPLPVLQEDPQPMLQEYAVPVL
ncbi:uncharacterized protein LOC143533276 isoform X2 [Bidens hawaiensis]|uniref:uncharacterized protein LOC143533276 isoform X2 n=1 Tax=Bidens hawaiensis TaxID=980011 RepID=UPI00404B7E80